MALDYKRKTYVQPGETVRMELSYSEACMHMEVAGTVMEVKLVANAFNPGACFAQLYKDGRKYSGPVTTGEAGFYQDEGGYYYYPVAE